jgi:hypothetical protein
VDGLGIRISKLDTKTLFHVIPCFTLSPGEFRVFPGLVVDN